MSDLLIGADGDLEIQGNTIPLVSGKDAIAQDVLRRLAMFKGEWFRDTRIGVPYYESILVKNPSLPVVRTIYTEAILETPGVSSLSNLTVTFTDATRSLAISFEIRTIDGDVLDFDDVLIGSGV